MKKSVVSVPLALLLAVLFTWNADAGVLKIRPDELKPRNSTESYTATPEFAGGPVVVQATVNLPARVTLKRLIHFSSNGLEGKSAVTLYRVKMGEHSERMAETISDTQNYPDIEEVATSDITNPVILPGYTYYLVVLIVNNNTLFRGVKLVYQ